VPVKRAGFKRKILTSGVASNYANPSNEVCTIKAPYLIQTAFTTDNPDTPGLLAVSRFTAAYAALPIARYTSCTVKRTEFPRVLSPTRRGVQCDD
jgi:hypothetical protein